MNNQDRWKRLFQQGQDCPSIEELGNYLSGSQNESERTQVASHVRDCSKCSCEMTLLRQFNEGDVRPAEKSEVATIVRSLQENTSKTLRRAETQSKPRSESSFWRDFLAFRPVPLLATAMAGVLVVMAASLLLRTAPDIAPIFDNGPTVLRTGTIRIDSPRGDVQQVPQELKWMGLEEAASYEVRISEVDRVEVVVLTTNSNSVTISPEIQDELAAGKPLFWQVNAFDSSGRQIAQSELARFALSMKD